MLLNATACAHVPLHPASQSTTRAAKHPSRTELPADVLSRYAIPDGAVRHETLSTDDEHDDFTLRTIRLTHPGLTSPIELEWYAAHADAPRPLILVLPILGGSYPIERSFCRFFAGQGLHAVLIHREKLDLQSTKGPAYIEELLSRAIVMTRVTVRWLAEQPDVDNDRIGLFGISMGGVVGVMVTAVEPRIRASVIALAGGPLSDIFLTTSDRTLLKPKKRYLKDTGLSEEALHRQLTEAIVSDPLRLAPYVPPDKVLFISARRDRTIRFQHSMALWKALGLPELVTLPLGHYTSVVLVPYIWRVSMRFYQDRMDIPAQ